MEDILLENGNCSDGGDRRRNQMPDPDWQSGLCFPERWPGRERMTILRELDGPDTGGGGLCGRGKTSRERPQDSLGRLSKVATWQKHYPKKKPANPIAPIDRVGGITGRGIQADDKRM